MVRKLFVLSYDYVDDILDRRDPHRPGHLALIEQWHGDGRLVLAGAIGDPVRGALLVFDVADAAEIDAFTAVDPYMSAGLVAESRVEPLAAVAG